MGLGGWADGWTNRIYKDRGIEGVQGVEWMDRLIDWVWGWKDEGYMGPDGHEGLAQLISR